MPRYIRVSCCPKRDSNGKCAIKPFCRFTANKALRNCEEGTAAFNELAQQSGYYFKTEALNGGN